MYTYNITWNDTIKPYTFNQSCHIQADNLTDLSLKFNQLHPTGFVFGLVVLDN